MNDASAGPLAGLKVIELGQLIAGPFAAKTLADFGAEVIKIEPPGGDPLRQWRLLHDGSQRVRPPARLIERNHLTGNEQHGRQLAAIQFRQRMDQGVAPTVIKGNQQRGAWKPLPGCLCDFEIFKAHRVVMPLHEVQRVSKPFQRERELALGESKSGIISRQYPMEHQNSQRVAIAPKMPEWQRAGLI